MLAKDSVQVRLERGLSFTEFSYMLLQAYDFAHLYRTMGVELQMGGADQWGNITAGLELIRRLSGVGQDVGGADDDADPAHAPRLQAAAVAVGHQVRQERRRRVGLARPGSGRRPFAFYQYWLNTDDRDVGTYLRWFTELPRDEIEALEAEAAARPELRPAQRALARDITARTHGDAAAAQAIADSEAMFSSARDRRSRACCARSTSRPAGSPSMPRRWPEARPSCWPTPASSRHAARPVGRSRPAA